MLTKEGLIAMGTPIVVALLIIIVGAFIVKAAMKLMTKALEKTKIDPALHTFIKNIAKVALWLLIIVTALGKLGIPTSTFVTVIGACGAAIALALKDSLSNVAGGILILVTKPFGKGDYIEAGGAAGTVDKIDLMTTTIRTIDNKVVRVPNSNMSTSVVTNYSEAKDRRVDNNFGIGYECDIDKAREIILKVPKSNELVFSDPEPVVLVGDHADSAVVLHSRVWCKNADYWTVYFYMQEQVKKAFDEGDINIPYPQVDLHVIK
ncbi:MAG: mechanosensitive ion channel [Firmicutes bacterium]|nr:mechanosensitive ion channel [Bacillota bacterium]